MFKTRVLKTSFPGDNSELVPPDPFPNSEVKRLSADGSVGLPHVRVGHCQVLFRKARNICYGLFLYYGENATALRVALVDVLLVKDTSRKGFREGIPNYASSAAELLRKLAAVYPFDRYTSRYAFGTSGGGAIALLAGCMFDFDATSVVGASDSGFRTMLEDESDWLSLRRSQGNQRPTITLVYGSQSRVDKRAAIALDEMLGVHHTEITSAAESMKHNCLYSVVKAGRFSELLSTTLLLPDASELQSAAAPLSQFEV